MIYTPENFRKPNIFNISCIPKTHFDKNRKTMIVIHGFSGTDYLAQYAKTGYFYITQQQEHLLLFIIIIYFARTACFENGQHNVNLIGVDWTEGSQDPIYVHSAHRVEHVGEIVGKFIERAADEGLINLNKVELIGHSLGAHASGFGIK